MGIERQNAIALPQHYSDTVFTLTLLMSADECCCDFLDLYFDHAALMNSAMDTIIDLRENPKNNPKLPPMATTTASKSKR